MSGQVGKKQVDAAYYAQQKYATMERFISYFHQIKLLRDSGAQTILLVGVGDGLVPHYLREVLGLTVTTCDIDSDLKPDVVGDVRALPFADGAFDAVAVYEVLEHLPFAEFDGALKEIARVSSGAVVVSLPHRHTGVDMVLKFPYIRSLLRRDFLRLLLTVPITFPGFAVSKQHYWEIEREVTTLGDVRAALKKHFTIEREERAELDAYRHFFVLQKHAERLDDAFVRTYYNEHLRGLEEEYTAYRWHATPATRFDYGQTMRAIQHALGTRRFSRVLEVGPGDGAWTPLVAERSDTLVLLDQSEEMLSRAQERLGRYAHITYERSDFLEYESAQKFDLIFSVRCFEYFEDQAAAVRKLRSLLVPGGKLVLVTKNRTYVSFRERAGRRLHKNMVSREEMVALLVDAGFSVQTVLGAVVRVKAGYVLSRVLFGALHVLHVATGGRVAIPWLSDRLTESYLYVAERA